MNEWVVELVVYVRVVADNRGSAQDQAKEIVKHGHDLITDVDVTDSYVLAGKGPVQAAAEGRG